MQQFAAIALPDGTSTTLALKIVIASGPARRLVVGDPSIQLLDTLAGATVSRMASGKHLARQGEILIDEATATALGDRIEIAELRTSREMDRRFAVLVTTDHRRLTTDDQPIPWSAVGGLLSDQLRPSISQELE